MSKKFSGSMRAHTVKGRTDYGSDVAELVANGAGPKEDLSFGGITRLLHLGNQFCDEFVLFSSNRSDTGKKPVCSPRRIAIGMSSESIDVSGAEFRWSFLPIIDPL